ncbi:hypothetical protein E3E12_08175 [Formicincola oecophyllae]|uniref:Uncharacterized protein n=1 Tax=Formicincola oecophyllae TaxID=2558361 RepID=A0A4Y6U9V3_9PROT|nr:hypothetical protein [Formicincola oecophyllae]QDH14172.1 hypothetical protein E3E12_08175 [Formicincola oecophyllae]
MNHTTLSQRLHSAPGLATVTPAPSQGGGVFHVGVTCDGPDALPPFRLFGPPYEVSGAQAPDLDSAPWQRLLAAYRFSHPLARFVMVRDFGPLSPGAPELHQDTCAITADGTVTVLGKGVAPLLPRATAADGPINPPHTNASIN